jgi:hypothetical protein
MRKLIGPLRLALLISLVACGDAPTEPTRRLTAAGPWEGQIGTDVLTLILNENEYRQVGGSAALGPASGPRELFDAVGSRAGMSLSLTISDPGSPSFTLVGTISVTEIRGVLDGSSFTNDSVVLGYFEPGN